jgi:hypothetical protein
MISRIEAADDFLSFNPLELVHKRPIEVGYVFLPLRVYFFRDVVEKHLLDVQ